MPAFVGEFDLEYENKNEEEGFIRTRRLNGFHIRLVKKYWKEEAWRRYLGDNFNKPEPKGRGAIGYWAFDILYACLDKWYKEYATNPKKGRFTEDEVDNFWAAWKSACTIDKPLSDEQLLDEFRKGRKGKKEAEIVNARKRDRRRTKAWEQKFQSERDPNLIYRRLRASLPVTTIMDEQILRSFARSLAEANDLLWQSEQYKDDTGKVIIDLLPEYTKVVDLINKVQRQVAELLKSHGYDYTARRARRETQTAAEVFDDFVQQAVVLFDQRAIEYICPNCKLSLGYFVRHFPTVRYLLSAQCPRCNQAVNVEWTAAPDEVMDA